MIFQLHSHDSIFTSVKMESSYLAERAKDKDGEPMFEEIVFDEEYFILFRDLFFDARANVVGACSAYMKDQTEISLFEQDNFDKERDFIFRMDVPDFIPAYLDSLSIKIKSYLVAHILYRWLEHKMPAEAQGYLERSNSYLKDVSRFLELRKERRIRKSWPN